MFIEMTSLFRECIPLAETLSTYLCQRPYSQDERFILFENQGISNPSSKQYLEKDYSSHHEFSYHLNTISLVALILYLLYMYILTLLI